MSLILAALTFAAAPIPGAGAVLAYAQVVGGGDRPPPEPIDSADVQGRARGEQARFERQRRRLMPVTASVSHGSDCDEIVGRFCLWFDESTWVPEPESPELGSLRTDLVTYLDSVQTLVPGDGWILGQRVWYDGEGGHWDRALTAARGCGTVEDWWCAALEGLALHGLERFPESERAFDRALSEMDPEQARKWREPRRAVDGGVRDALKDAREDGAGDDTTVLDRIWTLADPSYLVPGNDRKTEHYARWTVAVIRERARNPYRLRWGRDMEELLVRFGWEVGWERGRNTWRIDDDVIVGHQHPAGREYMPPKDAIRDPASATAEDFVPGQRRPRSLYAPPYAPVILPMDGQIAAFPRGDSLVVVATTYLPADTTRHPGDDDPRPWMDAGDQAGLPDERGLFLVPAAGGPIRGETRTGGAEGSLTLRAPAGAWVVSAEAWSPPARVEGRTRQGLRRDTVPRDVATLSDLLLVSKEGGEPVRLAEAARRALTRKRLHTGEEVGVVWELNGLGWNPSTVSYDLSLERTSRGLFRRLGEGLGLVGKDRPLSLQWEEPGPDQPEPALRYVAVTLPDVGPGTYRLRLRVRVSGRGAMSSDTDISVVGPR